MSRTSAIGLVLELNVEGLAVIALALADIAGDVDIGQEVHLDLDDAIALAGFAASAFDVEGEAPRLVAARFGFRQSGKPVANRGERAGVGGGVRPRCAADGDWIDVDDFVDKVEPVDVFVCAGDGAAPCRVSAQGLVEGLNDSDWTCRRRTRR